MLSIKLHFRERKEFLGYQKQFSRCVRRLYSNADLLADELYRKETLTKHPLMDASLWDSICIYVKMKHSQMKAFKEKQQTQLTAYITAIDELDKDNKWYKRNFFKLTRKIKRIEAIFANDSHIVFGGKKNLQNITYNHNMFNKTGETVYKEQVDKHLKIYRNQRDLGLYCVGRACEGGNRKFDFDFTNNTITFKPDKKNHFKITYKPSVKQYKTLYKIQQMVDEGLIPLTVTLSTNSIIITYDNALLNGYQFKKRECAKAQQEIHEVDKELKKSRKKEIYIKYKQEQESRMLEGKDISRFAGIDLNPDKIGLTIRDDKRIIFTKAYEIVKLVKTCVGNDTTEIKYNLDHVYKAIFNACIHYKVSHFVTEDLDFKYEYNNPKSFNRKVKNLWCRERQKNLILKYCENLGMKLVQVNPAYSSFIGNLLYQFYDPISASAEIVRRGMILCKKIADDWYPAVKRLHLDNLNLETYVLDLESGDLTIKSLFKQVTSRNLRYRHLGKPKSKSKLIKCLTYH